MYPRALDRRRDSSERIRIKWQRSLECDRIYRLLGSKKCQRNPWHIAFLATKARPKRRADQRLDSRRIGYRRQVLLAAPAALLMAMSEVGVHSRRGNVSSWVGLSAHTSDYPVPLRAPA